MVDSTGSASRPAEAVPQRRLIALVHADVIGFSRLVGLDDRDTSTRLRRLRAGLIVPLLERHGGTLVNTAGDAFLMSFQSVMAAVECAVDLQNRVPEFDEGRPQDQLIRLRVGVDLGDVLADDTDVMGDGINVAARLQAICPPGGVCVSRAVHDHVRGKLNLAFSPLGTVMLKNIRHPVEAFALHYKRGGVAVQNARDTSRRTRSVRSLWAAMAVAAGISAAGTVYWRRDAVRGVPEPPPSSTGPANLSLAVLPFTNLSGDSDQAYLADGIAEDLTTDLSQLPGTTVIARESAFSYRGKQVDVREVGRQLGVRYVIEGSIRKLGETVRVNAQLVSAETGAHLWAERFDKPVRELEGGMVEVVTRIGAALNVKPNQKDAIRRQAAPGDPGAFDLVLRARSVLNEPRGDGRDAIARGLFEQALRRDPASVPAMAGVASMIVRSSREPRRRASLLVAEAERLAPNSPDVLSAKFLLLRSLGRWGESVQAFRALLDVDSSAAGIALQGGRCPRCWGTPDEAIPLLQRTAMLNPRSPNSAALYIELGRMLLLVGRTDDAIGWLERVAGSAADGEPLPDGDLASVGQLLLGAACAFAGRLDEAHRLVTIALRSPNEIDLTLGSLRRSALAITDPASRNMELRLIEGFKLAGLRDHLDEAADSHVPSDGALRDLDQLDAPTPMTVPGGTTILTNDLQNLIRDANPLLVTTAGANPTIAGAILMAVTYGGNMTDQWQLSLDALVAKLTGGDKHRPIVTFAGNINRWHSRNLALRLIALGYDHVYWYRGGVEAWTARGLPTAPLITQTL